VFLSFLTDRLIFSFSRLLKLILCIYATHADYVKRTIKDILSVHTTRREKEILAFHLTELPKVKATILDMTAKESAKMKPILDETYGKVVYFWQLRDLAPMGEPSAIIIEEQAE
jgi:hypothetical protein